MDEGEPLREVVKALRHDAGQLFHGESRYLLIRPETLVALQKSLVERLGDGAAEHLVAAGRAGGGSALTALGASGEDAVRRLIAMGTAIGWGEFSLEHLDGRRFVVAIRHSPFADAHGPSVAPVCHVTRGVLERVAEAVFDGPARVTETACAATGAPLCRFEACA